MTSVPGRAPTHGGRADSGPPLSWSVDELRSNAIAARREGDQDKAIDLLERALEEVHDAADPDELLLRRDLLLELAGAEARTRPDDAIRHFRAAIPLLEDRQVEFWTRIHLARCLSTAGRANEALAEADAAAPFATTDEDRARADIVYVSLARQSLDTRPKAGDRLEQLARRAAASDAPWSRAVKGELSYEGALAGSPRESVNRMAMDAIGGESMTGLHELPPLTRHVVLLTLMWCGDYGNAARAARAVLARAEGRGAAVDAAAAQQILCNLALRRGELDTVLTAADEILARSEAGFRVMLPSTVGMKAMALAEQGRTDEALAALRLPGGEDEWTAAASFHGYLIGRARVRLLAGDPEGALRAALHLGTLANTFGTTNPAVLPWRTLAALAACELGDVDRARGLAEEEVRLTRAFGAPGPVAAALRALARTAPDGAAIVLLDEALALLEAGDDVVEKARATLDLAVRMHAVERDVDAAALAGRAIASAERVGARQLVDEAERLVDELRASEPEVVGGRVAAITTRTVPTVRVRALGGFSIVTANGDTVTPPGAPGKAIRVLIGAGRPVHIEELAEILWNDVPSPERMRARLRTTISRARLDGRPLIVRSGELLALADDVSIDADDFERDARAALSDRESARALEQTVAASLLYTGDLLPTDPYADWAVLRREQLRMRYLSLCDHGADLAMQRGLHTLAVDLLEAAIRHDPYDDERIDRAAAFLDRAGRGSLARSMRERAERTRRSL